MFGIMRKYPFQPFYSPFFGWFLCVYRKIKKISLRSAILMTLIFAKKWLGKQYYTKKSKSSSEKFAHKINKKKFNGHYIDIALQGLLISCNQMSAEYLFMPDKLYDVQYDTGDKVIQCGRHNDVFKLWLQWRAKVSIVKYISNARCPAFCHYFFFFPLCFIR